MIKLLILTDEYGFFTESVKTNVLPNSVDVNKIVRYLKEIFKDDIQINYLNFRELVLEHDSDYTGCYVIYTSSDDFGLFYKDYIEDILLRLQVAGAILIPDFNLFRAHHNKVYMELYKTSFLTDEENGIHTMIFSSYNMIKKYLDENTLKFPVVVKSSSGAGSCGVGLAKDKSELLRLAKKFSYRKYWDNYANLYRTPIMQKIKNAYRKMKKDRIIFYKPMQGKFLLQTFVKNLNNDFKVLVFGEKYYVLKRLNRDGDFRASGSGKFIFPDDQNEIIGVLNYAKFIYERLNVPCASLDIADDGKKNYLIEYQCVNFGPYTLEKSDHYFMMENEEWKRIDSSSELDREYVNALSIFLKKQIIEML